MNLNEFAKECHEANKKWWLDLANTCITCHGSGKCCCPSCIVNGLECITCKGRGYPLKNRNIGELLMLCVSELAEAMEGHRKNLMDDKLPHRSMFEVELVDCMIRIGDLAGGLGLDLEGAYREKMAYNASRQDHKIEARLGEGGKKY